MEQVLAGSLEYNQLIPPQWMSCSADLNYGNGCGMNNATSIHSFQAQYSCFSLFHTSVLSEFQVSELSVPIGIKGSPFIIGAYEVESDPLFQPISYGEMVRFVIHVNSSLSLFDNSSTTARVSVIENNRIRTTRNDAFLLKSNEMIIISLKVKLFNLLPPPYESMCFDYADSGDDEKHPLFKFPRSRRDCMKACVAKLLIKNCKCWPPEVPFVSLDNLPATQRLKYNVPLCDWVRMSRSDDSIAINRSTVSPGNDTASRIHSHLKDEMTKAARTAFKKCFQNIDDLCTSQCPKNCQFKEYDQTIQIFKWPYEKAIKYSAFGNFLKNFTSCCSLVSIRYSTPMFARYFMESKYELVEIITYMGGLVSLWLGFTVISVYSFINRLTVNISRKKKIEYHR